jgi:hypothetical protein
MARRLIASRLQSRNISARLAARVVERNGVEAPPGRHTMHKNLKAATMAAALAGALMGAPLLASAQPFSIAGEAAAHPRIVQAIRQSEAAYRLLQAAPDDFGGRKAQAMMDLRRAIHSMRAALFFRMHLDDRAIDAAVF